MGANCLGYILCITFRIEAITIGFNLAISPIFITEQFGKDTVVIGIMLVARGWCWIWNSREYLNNLNQSRKNSHGKIPVLLASVPSFPVHVIGLFS
jgi:hypothetical protein